MLLAGINFTLLYFVFQGLYKRLLRNEEFVIYMLGCVVVLFIVMIGLLQSTDYDVEYAFRTALFM